MKKFFALLCFLGIFLSTSLFAQRVVIDQLGRKVTLPDTVSRVVVLQHQALNIINQLNGMDSVVGVLSSWKKRLGKDYIRLAPSLEKLPMPGDLKSVNIESILALKPDAVFVTHYLPKEYITQMEKLHIPVVAISLFKSPSKKESQKLNPTLKDVAYTYDQGLYDAISLIGEVINHQKDAKELITYTKQEQIRLTTLMKRVDKTHPVKVYIANPDMTTYGSGKYTGIMLERAGALNVAAKKIKGYKQVSMENVLAWNPEVILVQSRYAHVVDEIKKDKGWGQINAVKNNRIYLMPEYAKAWGHPMAEALAIGELWLAQKLYPKEFQDIDMQKEADAFYRKFYRTPYTLHN
jgi:iron complex transport system substrate-binding protein